jgi:DNA-directed RNA polymerase specialized sigma24 family protein
MVDTRDEALQRAIIGLPQVAEAIAALPADARSKALTAVEHSYRQSAQDLGCSDDETQSWVEAMMFRLRNEVDKRQSPEQKIVGDSEG